MTNRKISVVIFLALVQAAIFVFEGDLSTPCLLMALCLFTCYRLHVSAILNPSRSAITLWRYASAVYLGLLGGMMMMTQFSVTCCPISPPEAAWITVVLFWPTLLARLLFQPRPNTARHS